MGYRTEPSTPTPPSPERKGFAAVAHAFRQLPTVDLERCADLLGVPVDRLPARDESNYHEKLVWTLIPILIFREVSPADVLDQIYRTFGPPDRRRSPAEPSPRMPARESIEEPPLTLFRLITEKYDHPFRMKLLLMLRVNPQDVYALQKDDEPLAMMVSRLFRLLEQRHGDRWVAFLKAGVRNVTPAWKLDQVSPLDEKDRDLVDELSIPSVPRDEEAYERLCDLPADVFRILVRFYAGAPMGIYPSGHPTHAQMAFALAAWLDRHRVSREGLERMIAEARRF